MRALEDRIAELEASSLDPQQSIDHIHRSRDERRTSQQNGSRHEIASMTEIRRRRTSSTTQCHHPSQPAPNVSESPYMEINASPVSTRAAAASLLQDFPAEADLSDENEDIDHLLVGLATSPGAQRERVASASPGTNSSHHLPHDSVFMPHALIASIPADVEKLLLNVYRERAQTQYPFFHWDTFTSWHLAWKTCPPSQYAQRSWQGFFVNVTYATALLLRPFPRIGKSDAQTFYTQGLSLLPAVLKRQDPLLHIQAHLLLSMYALHRSSTQRILSLASTTMRYCVQQQFHLAAVEPEPNTPETRLLIQIRRRCFWCAYKLDRLIVASFDLPPSVPDAMITVKVFANVEDQDILDLAAHTPSDQELPDAPRYTSVSPSLHILQCRRIQSEIGT